MKQLIDYVGLTCHACNEGSLEIKTETILRKYLEVYDIPILSSFISCNTCGASIIPLVSRQAFRLAYRQKIKQLYYG